MEEDLVDLKGVQLVCTEAVDGLTNVPDQLIQTSLVIGHQLLLRDPTRRLPGHEATLHTTQEHVSMSAMSGRFDQKSAVPRTGAQRVRADVGDHGPGAGPGNRDGPWIEALVRSRGRGRTRVVTGAAVGADDSE